MDSGYIKLWRAIQDNDIWLEQPFDRARAWIDMLLLTNHREGVIRVRGQKLKISRGQLGWSVQRLASRWGWSRGKVQRFFDELQNEHQIEQQKNNVTSLITIVNYERYQETQTAKRAVEQTPDGQQTDTNKNDKNDKKKDKEAKPAASPCPHEQIINLYHEKLPELQRVIISRWRGSSRAKNLHARWNEVEKHRDMEFWDWFFSSVRKNPHWLGDNPRGWKADLGWLLKRDNFDKVIERGASN